MLLLQPSQHIAAAKGHEDCVLILLKHACSLHLKGKISIQQIISELTRTPDFLGRGELYYQLSCTSPSMLPSQNFIVFDYD